MCHDVLLIVSLVQAAQVELSALRTEADCISWANRLFERSFVDAINDVLTRHPPHSTTAEGVPVWAPPRRCPHPLTGLGQGDAERVR
jgi:hypothetical protein